MQKEVRPGLVRLKEQGVDWLSGVSVPIAPVIKGCSQQREFTGSQDKQ